MAKDEKTITEEIKNFIIKNGGKYSDWYVGITEHPKDRLKEHNVTEAWIYREASSDVVARKIEEYFHSLGCDGSGGGGDENATFVYAYKKKSHTKE